MFRSLGRRGPGGGSLSAGRSEVEPPIETALGLLAVALLILANAYFVMAEFALVAVDRQRIEVMAEAGERRARRALALLRRLSLNLSGCQLGITISSLVLGFIAEPNIARLLEPALTPVPEAARSAVAIGLALGLATITQMIVGELVPKGVAIARPVPSVLAVAGSLRVYATVFGPVIRFLNGAADWVLRRVGIEPREELRHVRSLEELEGLVRSSRREGTLDVEAYQLLTRTIRFGHKSAADALVPRMAVTALPRDATVADLSRLAVESGHSRFPVVGEGLDDVVGVAYAKDVLHFPVEERERTPVTSVVRPPLIIPEGRDLESLLGEMRAQATQMAVVADEYGGVAGIVTLEDLLEEIVGEIEDEHDPVSPGLTSALPAGTFVLDGGLHPDEVADITGLEVPEGPYETLAGFLLDRLGHLPEAGEQVEYEGWCLEVLEMDRRRIASVRVVAPAGDDQGEHS
ncbi:MAG: hemolysin family protein [Actinomycetota bacterium]|nr:hemolysin family protein [Actinomycetota bacterium]